MVKNEEKLPHGLKAIWRNRLTPVDIFILQGLSEGLSSSSIEDKMKRVFSPSPGRGKIENRIKHLEEIKDEKNPEDRVLFKKSTIIVNPSKLYDHVYIAFIKINFIKGQEETWKGAYKTIKKINDEEDFERPIKILFNVGGTGEYDFVALIFTNDLEKYHNFKAKLVKQNLIEKFDTKYVETEGGFMFEPVDIPDYHKVFETTAKYKKSFDYMNEYKLIE